MADMNDVTSEMLKAIERTLHKTPTQDEKLKLIKIYNSLSGDDIFAKCREAIEQVYNIKLDSTELLEKTASVDRVMMAIKNLKNLSSKSVKK